MVIGMQLEAWSCRDSTLLTTDLTITHEVTHDLTGYLF